MQRDKNRKGFTLIELLIVVIIIGVLASIAYPAYTEHTRKSRRSDAYVALTQLANAQEKIYLNCNSYTTFITAATSSVGSCAIASSGLGFTSATSPQGYYNLDIPTGNTTGYTVRATATGIQAADTTCPSLSLTSTGAKTPAGCWK
ncbi:MAG: type IV pilin protein [Sulfuricaulis sp.]